MAVIQIDSYKLELETVRRTFENRFAAPAKIRQQFKLDDFKHAAIHVTADKKFIHASWSNYDDTYALPFYIYDQIINDTSDYVVYVEQRDSKSAIYIRIDNGRIIEDTIGSMSAILEKLYGVKALDEHDEIDHRFLFYGVDDETLLSAKRDLTIQMFAQGLTKSAHASDLTLYKYRPLKDAVKKAKGVHRVNPLYVWAGIFVAASLAWFVTRDSEVEVVAPQIIDRFGSYKTAITSSEVDAPNRAREDYNNHILFMSLPAWDVAAVQHSRDFISYTVEPKSNGAISALNTWARENQFNVIRVENEITLAKRPANVPVYDAHPEDVPIHSVDAVTDLLSDAVTLYISRATLVVQRDHTQGRESWKRRDVSIGFTNAYKEDLLTLAAIIESAQLPVSIAEANYRVNNERLTGTFILRIFGE